MTRFTGYIASACGAALVAFSVNAVALDNTGTSDNTGMPPQPDARQPVGDSIGQGFSEMDANSDGYISKQEAGKIGDERFNKIDTNGDGQIDNSEFSAFETGRPTP